MIPLLAALALSTSILIAFRYFERFKINILHAIIVNYATAVVFGLIISKPELADLIFYKQPWFIYGLVIGVFFIVVFNIFAHSSQKIGIGVTAVASKMSVVIPVLLGVLLYKESLGITKTAGIVLAIAAFWFTLGGTKSEQKGVRNKYWYLPVLLFFGNGINDSLMKHVETTYIEGSSMLLLTCIFTVALVLGLLYSLSTRGSERVAWSRNSIIGGIILGLLNLGSTYYFFESLAIFSNTVFFPVFNVSIVSLSAFSGRLLFGEKLSSRKLAGIAFAILSIILIALSKS